MKFTECCGKAVESHKENMEIYKCYVEGPIPATGDTFCSRCKRDVTRNGNVKNTIRNADIDIHGNWKYVLKEFGKSHQGSG